MSVRTASASIGPSVCTPRHATPSQHRASDAIGRKEGARCNERFLVVWAATQPNQLPAGPKSHHLSPVRQQLFSSSATSMARPPEPLKAKATPLRFTVAGAQQRPKCPGLVGLHAAAWQRMCDVWAAGEVRSSGFATDVLRHPHSPQLHSLDVDSNHANALRRWWFAKLAKEVASLLIMFATVAAMAATHWVPLELNLDPRSPSLSCSGPSCGNLSSPACLLYLAHPGWLHGFMWQRGAC